MKKLSNDNPFFEFMDIIGDWGVLNILFVLTSLPIITIGMSITAMYRIILREKRGECTYIVKEYFKVWKEEWKQSSIMWIMFLLTGTLLLFDILYIKYLGEIFAIAIGGVILIWSFVFSYAFPLQARFQNSIKNTLKNALFLAVRYFPYTILIVGLNSIPIICIIAGPFPTMILLPIYCFIGFTFIAKINCIFFDKIFQDFMSRDKEEIEV